jgi:hypothetical protein
LKFISSKGRLNQSLKFVLSKDSVEELKGAPSVDESPAPTTSNNCSSSPLEEEENNSSISIPNAEPPIEEAQKNLLSGQVRKMNNRASSIEKGSNLDVPSNREI